MSDNCKQSCDSCKEDCADRKSTADLTAPLHPLSSVGKVIGVVSGKGGVGKTLVTSLMASAINKKGYQTAILDADITGPSIPRAFGLREKASGSEEGIYPVRSSGGIDIMSVNLLLADETDPVVWRGPVIAGSVKQFWTDVIWTDVDYMFIDMPPGTGDVPLTVFQSIPVDGIVVVMSPQELVSMIVEKAVKMAEMMHVPIFGLVENMSYFHCPDNGKDYKIFGDSHIEEIAQRHSLPVLARIPIDPATAEASDRGTIEQINTDWLDPAVNTLIELTGG
jgi:Mrp family chromosome partitioning ATPase